MRAIDHNTITDAVIEQMSGTPNPRLRWIMESLVRHLHEFAREVDLTPQEWLEGITFLTAVGQKSTPFRQEFIILSDTLGRHLPRGRGPVSDHEGRGIADFPFPKPAGTVRTPPRHNPNSFNAYTIA